MNAEMIQITQARGSIIVLEAIQLTWTNWSGVCEFVDRPAFLRGVFVDADGAALPDNHGSDRIGLLINTKQGQILAVENDFIIRHASGDYSVRKPDTFTAEFFH